MWFGEPHPFPERGSPTGLGVWRQQSYEGWSCRTYHSATHVVINNRLEDIKMVIILFTPGRQHTSRISKELTSDKWSRLFPFLSKMLLCVFQFPHTYSSSSSSHQPPWNPLVINFPLISAAGGCHMFSCASRFALCCLLLLYNMAFPSLKR